MKIKMIFTVYLLNLLSFGKIVSSTYIKLSEGVKTITSTTTVTPESKLLETGEVIDRILSAKSKFFYTKKLYVATPMPVSVLDIVHQFFLGNKYFFQDTDIFTKGNTKKEDGTWIEYPVIKLDFATEHPKELQNVIHNQICKIAGIHRLPQTSNISTLITYIYIKYSNRSVVVLMDNYEDMITIVKNKQSEWLYYVIALQKQSNVIRMVFIQGAEMFNKVLGSEPNVFLEISFISSPSQSTNSSVDIYLTHKTTISTTIYEAPAQPSPTMAIDLPKLPRQSASFSELRQIGTVYVDKTRFVVELLRLITEQKFLFLARPRRFGKTVFLQTLKAFFQGNKAMFENTFVFNHGNTKETNGTWCHYPVIFLSFGFDFDCETKGDFKLRLRKKLQQICYNYELDIENCETVDNSIVALQHKFRLPVILLIDEYDIPLQKCRGEVNDTLTSFYTAIKDCYEYLRMVLITGVSRFEFTTLSSGLNNYEDLTFSETYAEIAGFTLPEVKQYFQPYLEYHASTNYDGDYEAVLNELIRWYDGYHFSFRTSAAVLNPVSTIQAVGGKEKFGPYWFMTGKRDGIVEKIKDRNTSLEYLSHYIVLKEDLSYPITIEDISFPVYLYNFGYYTIWHYNEDTHQVYIGFPNWEIFKSLRNSLPKKMNELPENSPTLLSLLHENNMPQFFKYLNYLTFIPFEEEYKPNIGEYEATRLIMQTLRSSHLKCNGGKILYHSLGNHTASEMVLLSKKKEMGDRKVTLLPKDSGDLDVLIYFKNASYVFEIKAKSDCVKAISQLLEYLFDNESEVMKAVDFSKTVNFVGFNVKYRKNCGTYIDEWVSIPYTNNLLYMNKMQATNITKVLHLFRTRPHIVETFSKHSDKIVWGENNFP